ncbi:MAG: translation elongation factor Ts [Bacteroidales bacterium]|jgi:elongation factor Ts|nr:translation elongation factor Ts [Bacteroidales bacterium]
MANITAAEVNKLRKQTGAGMMDCKKALVESEGDFEKAIDFLRKKGQKVAANRSDRDAAEGVVLSKVNDDRTLGAVIMINCETDFVAKNDDFVNYAQSVLDLAIANKAKTSDEVLALSLDGVLIKDSLVDKIGKIGEKIELGGYAVLEDASLSAYVHPGNRIATVVALNKVVDGIAEIGKDMAMQVAAMNPIALDQSFVDQATIDRELEVFRDIIRQEGKPEEMVDKIATGKLNKFFKESTLLNQAFIKDSKQSVSVHLKSFDKELTVSNFKRFALA